MPIYSNFPQFRIPKFHRMNKTKLLFLASIFYTISAHAQISGTLTSYPSGHKGYVYLYIQNGLKASLVDSVYPTNDGIFSFDGTKNKTQGFYQIALENGPKTEFIVGKEPLPPTEGKYSDVITIGFYIKNREMDAFGVIENLKSRYDLKLDSINTRAPKLNEFAPNFYTVLKEREKLLDAYKVDFNTTLNTITSLFPGTFVADVLAKLYRIPVKADFPALDKEFDTAKAFMHKHYYTFVDMNDERIIHTKFFETLIFTYLRYYSPLNTEGFKGAVDMTLAKATNEKVRNFIIGYYMELFGTKGPQEMMEYMTKTYMSSCEMTLSRDVADKVNKLKRLEIGKPAPDVTVNDISLQPKSLYGSAGKKATLIYFWSSTCTHCQIKTPEVYKTYERLRAKGFEVFAISLDEEYASWISFIQDKKLAWTNLCDMKGWKSPASELYMVDKTPTVFLLDGNLKIVDKEFPFEELEKRVEKLLN